MCGIFGVTIRNAQSENYDDFRHDFESLFLLSEARGQDAAGLAITSGGEISVLRRVIKPAALLKKPIFEKVLQDAYSRKGNDLPQGSFLSAIGHCRLVTNGSFAVHDNNQPIPSDYFVGVHNGIVLNSHELVNNNSVKKKSITAESGLHNSDTKDLYKALDVFYEQTGSIPSSVSKVFQKMEGSASIAFLSKTEDQVILATNTGSLFYFIDKPSEFLVFASERHFLKDFLAQSRLIKSAEDKDIIQIPAGEGFVFGRDHFNRFLFADTEQQDSEKQDKKIHVKNVIDLVADPTSLKRCTKCILPETYPYIEFDEKGVCNFCNRHENQKFKGRQELEKVLSKVRSKDGSVDCLVGLSGGRDSSYGMHILKNEFGMHPVAYTYDWGLTTDTSRRNQAKICGRLGIEHIIRSADIQRKRNNIRQNIYAWLKRPRLGMVPLFMAGDKDFYQLGRTLRNELNLGLTIFCSGCLLEQREFFVGFCGVNQNVTTTARLYGYSNFAKLKLASWYASQYIMNPAYINQSLLDSVRSFFTSFIFKDDFLYLYEYLPWNEKEIEKVLRDTYDWEADKGYGDNQWRMGDGQTAFTNYIFYTVAGFSEFDNFRSNQVREGLITREEALKLAKKDNEPKFDTLQYFSYVIGFNLDEVLAKINLIPKLY